MERFWIANYLYQEVDLDKLQELGQAPLNVETMLLAIFFILALAVLGYVLYLFRHGKRDKPTDNNTDNDGTTAVAVAAVKAAMQEIAIPINELVSALKKNAETENTHRNQEIKQGEATKTILEELTTAVISHNTAASAVIPTITEIARNTTAIKQQVTQTSGTVDIMSKDISNIKPQLDDILSGVNKLLDRVTGEVSLDAESLDTVREFVKVVKALEKMLPETEAATVEIKFDKPEKETIEAPKVPKPEAKPEDKEVS
jgi:methyl-accepting chemotaxis protein